MFFFYWRILFFCKVHIFIVLKFIYFDSTKCFNCLHPRIYINKNKTNELYWSNWFFKDDLSSIMESFFGKNPRNSQCIKNYVLSLNLKQNSMFNLFQMWYQFENKIYCWKWTLEPYNRYMFLIYSIQINAFFLKEICIFRVNP